MSKVPSNDIYELIKALSKSEKRYFKIFATRHKNDESDLIKLFDIIESRPLLSEEKILKQYPFRHFAMVKKRLYETLIKSLEDYHNEHSIKSKLRSELTRIEILIKKGLFEQANTLLKKLRAKAEKYEKHFIMLEAHRLEEEIIKLSGHNFSSELEIKRNFKSQKKILEQLHTILKYSDIGNLVYYMRRAGYVDNKKIKIEYDAITKQKIFSDKKSADSFEALYQFHYIKSILLFIQKKKEESSEHFKSIISLYEQHPHRIEEDPEKYIYNYASYISTLFQTEKNEAFLNEINKLLAFEPHDKIHNNDKKYVCYDQLMYFYSYAGDFEKALAVFNDLTNEVEEEYINQRKLHRLKYWLHGVVIFFGTGNYKKSIHWANKILNEPSNITIRKDIYLYAKIILTLNYFELKEEELLTSEVLSLYRLLKRMDALNKFEQTLIKAIKKSVYAKSKEKLREYFIETKKEFEAIKQSREDKSTFNEVNIIDWLESKITKKNYAEVLKGKRVQS